jgi:hypothetical protein
MNKKLAIYLFLSLSLWACGGSDPAPSDPNPTPISLTTLKLTFATTGETNQVAEIQDNDGAGGPNSPTINGQPLNLKKNKTYNVTAQVLNNAQDVSAQIINQGTTHQLRYSSPLANNLSFTYGDIDSNGRPIGIITTVIPGITATGSSITISLFRDVNKNVANSGTKVIEGTIMVNIID